jgi:sulfate adenylyltransferase
MEGYQALIAEYYPENRVVLGMLSTWMRYAGPREAVFHAIIRRNYGCTHFIIGRDHAGVGNYYGLYEAQDLARKFEGELGIQVLYLHGPYYCATCDGIVTEQTCRHHGSNEVTQISGTQIRAILNDGAKPDSRLMRPAVIHALRDVKIFIEDEDV